MKASFENIYSKIGYLFYAIASENGKLSFAQHEQLRKIVTEPWQPAIEGETTLRTHLVEEMRNSIWIGFHNCMTSKTAFELFVNCYFPHQLSFGPSLRERILATSRVITKEFTRWNSGGSLLMKHLEHLMNERVSLKELQPDQGKRGLAAPYY